MMDIQQAIQELVETKTFTLEGIKAIQTLRENFSKLTDDYAAKLVEFNKLFESNKVLASKNEELTSKVSEVRNRELSVAEREKAVARLEVEKACADKMVAHTLAMFNTVFANASLKTSVMRNVAVPVSGHAGNAQMGSYPMPGTVMGATESETTDRQVD